MQHFNELQNLLNFFFSQKGLRLLNNQKKKRFIFTSTNVQKVFLEAPKNAVSPQQNLLRRRRGGHLQWKCQTSSPTMRAMTKARTRTPITAPILLGRFFFSYFALSAAGRKCTVDSISLPWKTENMRQMCYIHVTNCRSVPLQRQIKMSLSGC